VIDFHNKIKIKRVGLDWETFSDVQLGGIGGCGVHKYVASPLFEPLLLSYSINGAPAVCLDLFVYDSDPVRKKAAILAKIPKWLIAAILDPEVIKTAYNANFELTVFEWLLGFSLDASQWWCTMNLAAYCGLPGKLDTVGEILQLERKKMSEGSSLIKKFCIPRNPTKNDPAIRNYPFDYPKDWKVFKEYNRTDVDAENEILQKLRFYKVTTLERRLWDLDQKINRRGIGVDLDLAHAAIDLNNRNTAILAKRIHDITGIENPNQLALIKKWIAEQTGDVIESLTKDDYPKLLLRYADYPEVCEVLDIRAQLGKTSIRKYDAMLRSAIEDDNGFCRLFGLLQYYGANRTGRWAGRIVQMHNLPKNKGKRVALAAARRLTKRRALRAMRTVFGNIPDTLSGLIRTALIPKPGHLFAVSDFRAIEGRVSAVLAGEQWKIDVYKTHGKIYEAVAAKMFGVPFETIVEGHENYKYRPYGKVGELAGGYQGGVNAYITMGALEAGIPMEDLDGLVSDWRDASPNYVRMWRGYENAAKDAINNPGQLITKTRIYFNDNWGDYTLRCNVAFYFQDGNLYIKLPSGRSLTYWNARLTEGATPWGKKMQVSYMGVNDKKQWARDTTYGGKLTENITQAISRDLLGAKMLDAENAGYNTVLHVHDEGIWEVLAEDANDDLIKINDIMASPVDWMADVPLGAAGFVTDFYLKD